MPRSGDDAKRKIVSAAETLFAAYGIDAVTLSQLNASADQRNNSAVQYHFGDREGVLRAILDKHQPGIDAERMRRLDELEAGGPLTATALAEVLVLPLTAKLTDTDGGPEFLQIQAAMLGRATGGLGSELLRPGARRLIELSAALDTAGTGRLTVRQTLVATLVFHGLADFARTHTAASTAERDEYVAILIEASAGLQSAGRAAAGVSTGTARD